MSGKASKVTFSKHMKPELRQHLFRELQKVTNLTEDGRVSWSGMTDVDQLMSTLGDAFTFPPEVSRRERPGIISRGIIDARKKGTICDSFVLETTQRIVDQKLSEPTKKFAIWSRVSYRPPQDQPDKFFAYADVSMRLARELPKYMQIDPDKALDQKPIHVTDKPGFCYLIAITATRNATHAADKVFRSTEVFKSVYNLALKSWNIFGSKQKPEAALLMGPYHFLFRGSRHVTSSGTWFNPEFREEFWSLSSTNASSVLKFGPLVRKDLLKLENHPLKEPLTAALLMMNEGMRRLI